MSDASPAAASRRRAFGTRRAWWQGDAPACRLATFRVALAVTTLLFHLPTTARMTREYVAISFHEPMIDGLAGLSPPLGSALTWLRWVAGVGLLIGAWPRACAGVLALSGAYLFALDIEHYSHNMQFHLLLLGLLVFAKDRVSLWRLTRDDATDGDDVARATCPAWPEHLLRLQVAIVFFFTALDKVFSPAWGVAGARVAALELKSHRWPLRLLQELNASLIARHAGVLSVFTIVFEFAIALAALSPATWGWCVALGIGFATYLEFAVEQNLFAWDVLATMLLFLPAGDRAYTARYDPRSRAGCAFRAVVARLDWMRRLRWVEAPDSGEGVTVIDPAGRRRAGLVAWSTLVTLLPGPLLFGLTIIRFISLRVMDDAGWSSGPTVLAMAGLSVACAPAWIAVLRSRARIGR